MMKGLRNVPVGMNRSLFYHHPLLSTPIRTNSTLVSVSFLSHCIVVFAESMVSFLRP
jgi:hypothetical protein